jgi:tetratricopeptide (TPR) repeat protein
VALVAVLLLTDWIVSDAPLLVTVRRNWRLYAPIGLGALAGVAAAWRVLSTSTSAGFQMQGMQWYEYALTQPRVLLAYIKLTLLPAGLTVDHNPALSTWPPDLWTVLALLFWVAAAATAFVYRRKYPVACYGLAIFLLFLAPTSSFIPIKDVMAERRMYLPLIGLLLIVLDGVSRLKMTNAGIAGLSACVVAALAIGTHNRSTAWGDDVKLWESAIAATPAKGRPYGNLASVYLMRRRCAQAVNVFDRAERAGADMREGSVLATWALALECNGNLTGGISKLQESVDVEPSAQAYSSLGRMYLRTQRLGDAEHALAEAMRLNAGWDMTYVYYAMLKSLRNDDFGAVTELKRALALNPANRQARKMLEEVAQRSRYTP